MLIKQSEGAYFLNHVGDLTQNYVPTDCITSSNDYKLMICTLFFGPCARCNDIMIRLVVRWSGTLDGEVMRVVLSRQTGFLVFAVFIFNIEVYKKCYSNSDNFGKWNSIEQLLADTSFSIHKFWFWIKVLGLFMLTRLSRNWNQLSLSC